MRESACTRWCVNTGMFVQPHAGLYRNTPICRVPQKHSRFLFQMWMIACAWGGHVRMVVKQWTRASRVSVSVRPDTPENTARQVGYADSRFWININSLETFTQCPFSSRITVKLTCRNRRMRVWTVFKRRRVHWSSQPFQVHLCSRLRGRHMPNRWVETRAADFSLKSIWTWKHAAIEWSHF